MIQAPVPTKEQIQHLQTQTFSMPTIGQMVYYTLKNPYNVISHRPALVLLTYPEAENFLVQLLVFTCPYEDSRSIPKSYNRRTPEGLFIAMAIHGKPIEPSTWHHIDENLPEE